MKIFMQCTKVAPRASTHRTKAIGYFEDGKLVKTYPSSRKAAADLYCSYQTILNICNHKYKGVMLAYK